MTRTTAVLIAVARFESIPSMPTFAKIEVNVAKTEDKVAKKQPHNYAP